MLVRSSNTDTPYSLIEVQRSHQGAAAKLPEINGELIERLLERASSILNRYGLLFNATAYGMTPVGHDDVERVFRSVQRDLRHARERVDAQVALLEDKR